MKNPVRFLLHVPVPWMFVLTYLLGVALEHVHDATISATAALVSRTAGAVLFALGAVIAGWGLVLFAKARTTTVPGKLSGKLVTWGPYRFTRNPMYVGLVFGLPRRSRITETSLASRSSPLHDCVP